MTLSTYEAALRAEAHKTLDILVAKASAAGTDLDRDSESRTEIHGAVSLRVTGYDRGDLPYTLTFVVDYSRLPEIRLSVGVDHPQRGVRGRSARTPLWADRDKHDAAEGQLLGVIPARFEAA